MDLFTVRIKYKNILKYVELNLSELNSEGFAKKGKFPTIKIMREQIPTDIFFLVVQVFNIEMNNNIFSGMVLNDNLGVPIPIRMLENVIKDFRKGSQYFINVQFDIADSRRGNIEIVTEAVCIIGKIFFIQMTESSHSFFIFIKDVGNVFNSCECC